MSYEAWGEPDDDYMTPEQAIDSGWWDPETVDAVTTQLRALDFMVVPGSRLSAQLILLQLAAGVIPETEPNVLWAQALLKDAK